MKTTQNTNFGGRCIACNAPVNLDIDEEFCEDCYGAYLESHYTDNELDLEDDSHYTQLFEDDPDDYN